MSADERTVNSTEMHFPVSRGQIAHSSDPLFPPVSPTLRTNSVYVCVCVCVCLWVCMCVWEGSRACNMTNTGSWYGPASPYKQQWGVYVSAYRPSKPPECCTNKVLFVVHSHSLQNKQMSHQGIVRSLFKITLPTWSSTWNFGSTRGEYYFSASPYSWQKF